jgi:hypothetical protein
MREGGLKFFCFISVESNAGASEDERQILRHSGR